ncbi:unnamed protein product [Calypogeia fissa]
MKRSSIIGSSNQVNKKSIFMDSQASMSAAAQGRQSAPGKGEVRPAIPPVRSSESALRKGDTHVRMTSPPVHLLESLVPDEAVDTTPREPPIDGAQKSQNDFLGG